MEQTSPPSLRLITARKRLTADFDAAFLAGAFFAAGLSAAFFAGAFLAVDPDADRPPPVPLNLIADFGGAALTAGWLEDTAGRIAGRRASAEGREGLQAFFDKRPARWVPPDEK